MVRTRGTPAPPATQTAAQDEDKVDYGDEADLTDVSELERQFAGIAWEPTSGQPSQTNIQVPATPEPAPTLVTVPMAFLNKMTDTMSAFTAHLSTLQGPQALSAQAQPALGCTACPPGLATPPALVNPPSSANHPRLPHLR
ncbi:hypothetical protein FN846DRAFT_887413 [Sphaerosporella brunnea]|uniref:Uncharacterized protein n=1 Tax=Sphaerosporella brunnea TaxID=1250544 RepID=A0A5J5F6H5_9PEZI|nr:hypothetical protein FN846DRAFT_887413 [Sphaerosporella brunnea]